MKHHVMTRTRNFCDRDNNQKVRAKLPSLKCLPDMVAEADKFEGDPTEAEIMEMVARYKGIEAGLARKLERDMAVMIINPYMVRKLFDYRVHREMAERHRTRGRHETAVGSN